MKYGMKKKKLTEKFKTNHALSLLFPNADLRNGAANLHSPNPHSKAVVMHQYELKIEQICFSQHFLTESEIDHHVAAPGLAQLEEERMSSPVPSQQKHDLAFLRETVAPDQDSLGNHYEED